LGRRGRAALRSRSSHIAIGVVRPTRAEQLARSGAANRVRRSAAGESHRREPRSTAEEDDEREDEQHRPPAEEEGEGRDERQDDEDEKCCHRDGSVAPGSVR